MKFCPECGAKYDGSGKCRTCGARLPKASGGADYLEMQILRSFQLERIAGGIRLLKCEDSSLDEFAAPASVKEIAPACFAGCEALESVDLSECGVTEIPARCFEGCAELLEVILPEGCETIGYMAFSGCAALSDIQIPEGVTEIGEAAFLGCTDMTDVTLPSTLRRVGERAFAECELLTDVYISDLAAFCRTVFVGIEANPLYSAASLTLDGEEIVDLVLPREVTKLLPFTFVCCDSIESLHIPSGVMIDPLAFAGCSSLETVTVDASHYYYRVEEECLLTKAENALVLATAYADVPASVRRVLPGALSADPMREALVFPGEAVLDKGALFGCDSLTSLTLGVRPAMGAAATLRELFALQLRFDSATVAYPCTLEMLTELRLLSARSIDRNFFDGATGLETLHLPATMTELEGALLGSLRLTSLTIPREIEKILPPFPPTVAKTVRVEAGSPYEIREGCLFETATSTLISLLGSTRIPRGTRAIAQQACSGNDALTELEIPEGVTSIGRSAFSGCKSLRALTVPRSLKRFYGDIVQGCTALERVTFPESERWSGRIGTEWRCESFDLGGWHDSLNVFSAKGSRYSAIVKGYIPPDKHYLIGD